MAEAQIRVLVVDDDHFVKQSLGLFVDGANDLTCVGQCSDGAEVLRVVRSGEEVDVVIMDVQMPVMDGVEATRRLLLERPGIKVIMWTAFEEEAVRRAVDLGAVGFLLKSAPVATVLEAVRAAHRGLVVLTPETARSFPAGRPTPTGEVPELTVREWDVLGLLCEGMSNAEIGAALFMSPSSVKVHLSHVLAKLGVTTRLRAVIRAHELGLMWPDGHVDVPVWSKSAKQEPS